MTEFLVHARNVTKTFGDNVAVNDFSLELSPGDIYGLVGPDGAGKTTTIRMLVGAMLPDHGEITVCGYDIAVHPDLARENLGYLSQRFSLYEDMTVLENIRFFSELRGLSSTEWLPRSMEILEFVGLSEFINRLAGKLSGGMKQKLGLATSLIHKPKLLLLDEPSGGVDPVTRQDFWQLIIRLVYEDNVGVLISTPYMDEVARCTRMGILQSGTLILEGIPDQLPELLKGQILVLRGPDLRNLRILAQSIPGVVDVHTFGDRIHVRVNKKKQKSVMSTIRQSAKKKNIIISQLKPSAAQLEDVFISLLDQEQSMENGG